jgi:hypothetical protein
MLRIIAAHLARLGHEEQSRSVAERALDWFVARDPVAYQQPRARALFLADRPEEALALLGPLVEDNPDDLTVHGYLGIALALTGSRDSAEAEAKWFEELDRPYLRGRNEYWQAAILAHLGRKDEAVRLLRQAFPKGLSYINIAADANFMPLWGYDAFERVIAPKG